MYRIHGKIGISKEVIKSMREEHGNRIFEVKETVITQCLKCNKKFNNPSLAYYVKDENEVMCVKCAKDFQEKELRIFNDMNENVYTKIIKDF